VKTFKAREASWSAPVLWRFQTARKDHLFSSSAGTDDLWARLPAPKAFGAGSFPASLRDSFGLLHFLHDQHLDGHIGQLLLLGQGGGGGGFEVCAVFGQRGKKSEF
jgi:hypothetical protein